MQEMTSLLFLRSAFSETGKFISTEEVMKWLILQNEKVTVNINKTALKNLNLWTIDDINIKHNSGRFFSIDGIHIKTNWGDIDVGT